MWNYTNLQSFNREVKRDHILTQVELGMGPVLQSLGAWRKWNYGVISDVFFTTTTTVVVLWNGRRF